MFPLGWRLAGASVFDNFLFGSIQGSQLNLEYREVYIENCQEYKFIFVYFLPLYIHIHRQASQDNLSGKYEEIRGLSLYSLCTKKRYKITLVEDAQRKFWMKKFWSH